MSKPNTPPAKTGEKGCDPYSFLEKFVDQYFSDDKEHCRPAIEQLYEHSFLDIKAIRNFLIVRDYQRELPKHDGFSLKTIEVIAKDYCMTTRQIQNILYKWESKFRKQTM